MSLSLSHIVLIILRSSVHAPPRFKMAAILATYSCQKKKKIFLLNFYVNSVYVPKFVALFFFQLEIGIPTISLVYLQDNQKYVHT